MPTNHSQQAGHRLAARLLNGRRHSLHSDKRWKHICICALPLLFGCAAGPTNTSYPSWGEVGYVGLTEYVDRKAGPSALNCGFFETFDRRTPRPYEVPGFACVQYAIENQNPFKYGTVRIPIDSYAYEVLVRDDSGTYWEIVYDVMIDGDAPQQWVRRCESVELFPKFSAYEGKECESVVDW